MEEPPDDVQRSELSLTVPAQSADERDGECERHGGAEVDDSRGVAQQRLVDGEPEVFDFLPEYGFFVAERILELETVAGGGNDKSRSQKLRIVLNQHGSEKEVDIDIPDAVETRDALFEVFRSDDIPFESRNFEADSSGQGVNDFENSGERRQTHLVLVRSEKSGERVGSLDARF